MRASVTHDPPGEAAPGAVGLEPYDAVVLASFGGPEGPAEVMPFLRNVTAGAGVPDERLRTVAEHYDKRGGVSPINEENRALLRALREELGRRGVDAPVLWGNRHLGPYLVDALQEAVAAGARRVLVLPTSAYSSYSSCRSYREALAAAAAQLAERVGPEAVPAIDKVRPFAGDEAFLDATARIVADTATRLLDGRGGAVPRRPHLAFVTHSIPLSMARTSGPVGQEDVYVRQHLVVAERAAARVECVTGRSWTWSLSYCSRSGPPHVPWLEPDVSDEMSALAADGVDGVVVAPVGFVADHMEVVHDLDEEAAEHAAGLGLAFLRAPSVRADPGHVAGLVDLLLERAAQARGEVHPVAGDPLPPASVCPAGCCPNLRADRPALCGEEEAT